MEYIAEIHSLSAKFFTDYPHSQYSEIAVKKNRPYSCLLIEYMDDLFICIPFRSHISHPYAYHFKSSARSQRSQYISDYRDDLNEVRKLHPREWQRRYGRSTLPYFESFLRNTSGSE